MSFYGKPQKQKDILLLAKTVFCLSWQKPQLTIGTKKPDMSLKLRRQNENKKFGLKSEDITCGGWWSFESTAPHCEANRPRPWPRRIKRLSMPSFPTGLGCVASCSLFLLRGCLLTFWLSQVGIVGHCGTLHCSMTFAGRASYSWALQNFPSFGCVPFVVGYFPDFVCIIAAGWQLQVFVWLGIFQLFSETNM